MSLRIFALLSEQGAATTETMICEDDLRVIPAVLNAIAAAGAAADIPDERSTFEDVTENDEAACRWCGRDRNESTRARPATGENDDRS
jgi:hypothetical protein